MISYVFDVDGTLTPARGKMDPEFKKYFLEWAKNKNVYLLTGSDAEKTIEQVGEDLWASFTVFQCNGNVVYRKGQKTWENKWHYEKGELVKYLNMLLMDSKYPYRFGNHIEQRVGMINFSTIGRNCDPSYRKKYFLWDNIFKERDGLVKKIKSKFPNLEITIGGEISVDIYPKGYDKGQIYERLEYNGPIYFFGDHTDPGGNDHSLAVKLKGRHRVFKTSGPEETELFIRSLAE